MTAFAYPETGALYETISIAGGLRHGNQVIQPLDDACELALMNRVKAGDFDARQQLVTVNLLHVLHNNRRYAHSGAGIFDLLKAGNRGLVHALENFEPEGDGRFSAYAASCIRQHIERALNPLHRPAERRDLSPAPHRGDPAGVQPQCV